MANNKGEQEQSNQELIREKKKQLLASVTERTKTRSLKPEDISVINVQLSIPTSHLIRQNIVIKDKDGSDGARIRDWDDSDQITKLDRDPTDIIRWEDKDTSDAGVA
jgi:hypothetical protein